MLYRSKETEYNGVLQAANQMCIAARTAPKAVGKDIIYTLILTDEDKDKLADKMEELGENNFEDKGLAWFKRDAANLRAAQCVVLIGAKRSYRGVGYCGYCGYKNCADCKKAGGLCAFVALDLGIALSSAVSVAAEQKIDNRIMMSIGKAAENMHYTDEDILWQGIPLSVSGKNIFFDRH